MEATVGYANNEDFELLSERYSQIAPDVLKRNVSCNEVIVARLGSDIIGSWARLGGEPSKYPKGNLTNPTAASSMMMP